MSDEENVREPTPDQDVNPEKSSTPEPADADGEREVSESEQDTSQDEPEKEKPRKRGASQRIGELVSLNKAKDAEIERLVRLLERGQTPQEAAGAQSEDQEPKRDSYDDYEAYLVDRAEWAARKTFREQSRKMEEEARQRQVSASAAETQARWSKSHDAAIDRYDDYEDVYEVVGTSIKPEQAEAIFDADDPAEIVYYLGKNSKEFAKFKELSGKAAIKAVGRIEERISAQRSQRSSAPPPVKPVKGSQPSPNQLSDDMPIEKWMALRNKQARG